LKTVQLPQGIEMVPLGSSAQEHFGISVCPLTDEGPAELPGPLAELCGKLSAHGKVAYVEAEIFGGDGTQAHALFEGGEAVALPVVADDAINQALRALGVTVGGAHDEFDAVGLGLHRKTDAWLV
jgi:hypothetical protein